MFEEPNDESSGDPANRPIDPEARAKEKFDQFRMHAEFAAVFEGTRKFDAQLLPSLDADLAREIQRGIGKLEKAKAADVPIIPPANVADAMHLLTLPDAKDLSTNDYHVSRRPGEVIIVRWLAGDEVDRFYERLQAHFDAALNQFRDEERQSLEWKQDPKTLAYLAALDAIDVKMADRYLRDTIRKHNLIILSTQAADELDILHLTDYVMGVPADELVGNQSAPGEAPSESDRAWFFKLFALRGTSEGVERMCFFAYLQKSDEGAW